MSTSHQLFDIPKRLSLSAQAANAMRNAIRGGTWRESLPSERRLCEMFQVSRPTIRTALHLLAKEGLLDIHQGRRNRILAEPLQSSRKNRLVGLVTHEPIAQMTLPLYQGISEMRTHLKEHGFSTEIIVCPPQSARIQKRKLEDFIHQNRVFCCVLLSVSRQLQEWFTTHSVPALVLGSCHSNVKLPSIDVDYRSVCRHAAGTLIGKRHRRIALIVPDSGVAGDLASEAGFIEATSGHSNASAIVVRHNGTAQSLTTKLDSLFNSASAPTALLVAKTQYVFIVIIYLLKRGLSVPNTVSLIARDPDNIFKTVSPPIAHYHFGDDAVASRLSRLMLQMVNQGFLPPEPNVIFPKYFSGGTVKQLD